MDGLGGDLDARLPPHRQALLPGFIAKQAPAEASVRATAACSDAGRSAAGSEST